MLADMQLYHGGQNALKNSAGNVEDISNKPHNNELNGQCLS